MKYIVTLALGLFLFSGFNAAAQDCDSIYRIVEKYITNDAKGRPFVSDGQAYVAFLDNEKAEFKTTLYGGSFYRIAASAGAKDDYVIFTVYDMQDNVLYSNRNFKNSPYWDFKVESTIPVRIETELDTDKKVNGCAVMLIGFLK
jgi:hypothetical protein